jgi:hypothetical protein
MMNVTRYVIIVLLSSIGSTALRRLNNVQQKHESCALVGTAGILLNNTWGEEIDSFPFVVRLSLSPIQGFYEHVGSKTSLRLLRTSMFQPGRKIPETFMNMIIANNSGSGEIGWFIENDPVEKKMRKIEERHPSAKFIRINVPAKPRKLCTKGRQATSGFSAAWMLLDTYCESLTLYGFHTPQQMIDKVGYHYYEIPCTDQSHDPLDITTKDMYDKKKKGGHLFSLEHKILENAAVSKEGKAGKSFTIHHFSDLLQSCAHTQNDSELDLNNNEFQDFKEEDLNIQSC